MAEQTQLPEDDARRHVAKLHGMLADIVRHARQDIGRIEEPKAQALLETTAEVCTGLATAYEHYELHEPAWR